MILMVNSESPAWSSGLKQGDILLEIDGIPINNIQDYYQAIAQTQHLSKAVKILRHGDVKEYTVDFNMVK